MHNVEKWLNILLKSHGVHTVRFLKCYRPIFNISTCMKGLISTMDEVKELLLTEGYKKTVLINVLNVLGRLSEILVRISS